MNKHTDRAKTLLQECRHFVKALCDHDDASCGCYQHIVLRGIDDFLAEKDRQESIDSDLLTAMEKIYSASSKAIHFGDVDALRDFITQIAGVSRAAIRKAKGE